MLKLFILNISLIIIITGILVLIKRYVKEERHKRLVILISACLTILCHYSSIIYHLIESGSAIGYLKSNPNLVLPIYPCNVVMWCCLIQAIIKKENKIFSFLSDYIFLFGIVSCLVGLFANVDFIRNQTLKDYDILKGVLAHAFMILNVLLIPTLGYYKFDFKKNILHIFISILMMLVIGLYCNLTVMVLSSKEYAYEVNSMFLIHSPFDGITFLTYPFISVVALALYSLIFFIISLIKRKTNDR